jgi:hypothetical protein
MLRRSNHYLSPVELILAITPHPFQTHPLKNSTLLNVGHIPAHRSANSLSVIFTLNLSLCLGVMGVMGELTFSAAALSP